MPDPHPHGCVFLIAVEGCGPCVVYMRLVGAVRTAPAAVNYVNSVQGVHLCHVMCWLRPSLSVVVMLLT